MESNLRIPVTANSYQRARLEDLRTMFAAACNSIAQLVRDTRCWNRVALHHMVYRQLRSDFPQLGAQMVCNVIYSVCRAARAVYQHPESPWRVGPQSADALPLIRFRETAPVYFDRHTLSLREGGLSLFTLDGRMKFSGDLSQDDEQLFRHGRIREIALLKTTNGFELHFVLGDKNVALLDAGAVIPEYIFIEDPEVSVLAERKLSSPTDTFVKAAR